jgi:phosphatidylglycerophosphate synthase
MCLFTAAIATVILVTLSYFTLWTASRADTPKGVSGFGKIMAIVLFVLSGFIIFGAVFHYSTGMCSEKSGPCIIHRMSGMYWNLGAKKHMSNCMRRWKKDYPQEWEKCLKDLQQEKMEKK